MSNHNPYRTIRRAFSMTGMVLIGTMFVVVIGLVVAAAWQGGMGAWALILPIAIPAGLAALLAVLMFITWPVELFMGWWTERERNWGPR